MPSFALAVPAEVWKQHRKARKEKAGIGQTRVAIAAVPVKHHDGFTSGRGAGQPGDQANAIGRLEANLFHRQAPDSRVVAMLAASRADDLVAAIEGNGRHGRCRTYRRDRYNVPDWHGEECSRMKS